MKNKKTSILFSLKAIYCKFFGHHLRVTKDITNHIREYRCVHCGEEMTDTASGFRARLTPKFRETNEFLAEIHERRAKKNIFYKAS